MVTCPKGCQTEINTDNELYVHLRNVHGMTEQEAKRYVPKGPGWYEPPKETPAGNLAEDHHNAALKSKTVNQNQSTLKVPIVPKEVKKEVRMPEGWMQTSDGYKFERTISEKHTAENLVNRKLIAEMTVNHVIATLYTYTKDITQLSDMKDKERILQARLERYTPSDTAFQEIINELTPLSRSIKRLQQELQPDIDDELRIEDYFRGEFGSDEHKDWQSAQMSRVITEVEQLKKQYETPKY